MEKSFPISPWKYALFATCILITACTVLFFSCGVVTWGSAASIFGSYTTALIGAAVFGVAFLGVYVALKESYKYSILFIFVSGLVIVTMVAYFFTFAAMKGDLLAHFDDRVRQLFEEKTRSNDKMQPIHSLFRCCGLEGPQDYLGEENGALPASCCFAFDCSNPTNVFQQGCATKANENLKMQADITYYCCMAIIALEFMGILTAYYMGRARKYAKTKIKDDESHLND
ncbi:23 kDa integral membrane protein [Drosophila miranda]|uniref:23 kDa integral membrane protein n=1 Tax=Drosophila miranda TaxID=7229 RepID=UPI0007E64E45|nr:23 kDa integral membrane protein [Drosophila miranda]